MTCDTYTLNELSESVGDITIYKDCDVIVLHVRSERVEVPFERVEFRWNYLIIMSGKANNSNVGARTLIDIFSKY